MSSETPTAPDCPAWLDPDARTEWERIVPQLDSKRLTSPVDMALVACYCKAYSRWRKCESILDTEGMTFQSANGNPRAHPVASIAKNLLTELRLLAAEFGLSPAARGRMKPQPLGTEMDDDEFFGRG